MATRYLETTQGRLAFDDTGGEGALVICLPGMGDLRSEYRYLSPQLQAAAWRVVCVDLRGQGQSSVPWPNYRAEAIGGDILALMNHLGVSNAAIVGNSFAAGAGVWAACQCPERISALVMIAPVVRNLVLPWYKRLIATLGFAGPWRVAFWMWYWSHLFASRRPSDYATYAQRLRANLNETGRFDATLAMINESKTDIDALLNQVTQPALVLMGNADMDFVHPPQEGEYVAQKMGAQLAIIPHVGHYPHVEIPEVAGPQIVTFLGQARWGRP